MPELEQPGSVVSLSSEIVIDPPGPSVKSGDILAKAPAGAKNANAVSVASMRTCFARGIVAYLFWTDKASEPLICSARPRESQTETV